jgi:predicted secreted Zn-dependent protease
MVDVFTYDPGYRVPKITYASTGFVDPPLGVTATAVSSTEIKLTWTDNSNNEEGFTIERKTGTGAFIEIATVGANVNSYSDKSLTAGISYTLSSPK